MGVGDGVGVAVAETAVLSPLNWFRTEQPPNRKIVDKIRNGISRRIGWKYKQKTEGCTVALSRICLVCYVSFIIQSEVHGKFDFWMGTHTTFIKRAS